MSVDERTYEECPVATKRIDVKELQTEQQRCESSLGNAQVVAEVVDVVLDLPFAESIRCGHVVGRQLPNGPKIPPLGPIRQPGESQVLDHAVAEL